MCLSKDFRILRTLAFLLGSVLCTQTRQVEHQRCSRTGRVQENRKNLRKKHSIKWTPCKRTQHLITFQPSHAVIYDLSPKEPTTTFYDLPQELYHKGTHSAALFYLPNKERMQRSMPYQRNTIKTMPIKTPSIIWTFRSILLG